MKLDPKFSAAIQEIEASRGIARARILESLEQGVLAAYEKGHGPVTNLEVEINLQAGYIEAFLSKDVVEKVNNPELEISLEEATKIDESAELGDSILIDAGISKLGNLAIHTFKQKVKALIRDAERDKVIKLYGDRVFELINCTVMYFERGDLYVETPDKIEGIIAYKEQIPREKPLPGQRLKCLLTEVRNVRKAPLLVFSRTHHDLLRELMKNEIPEVREGNIEIVAIARDPGQRAKVAVRSKLAELDPVGSCIGSRGIRITAISHEVNDEKIDLVLYKEDPFEFIAEALSPAKVMSVEIFEDERKGIVIVPDDQISLAIGKGWRNVKLASKLTRYYLDVKSVSEIQAEGGDRAKQVEQSLAEQKSDGEPASSMEQDGEADTNVEDLQETNKEEDAVGPVEDLEDTGPVEDLKDPGGAAD